MKILLLIFLSFNIFAQEELEEDKCVQELEQNCKEGGEIYSCLTSDPKNGKKRFSEKCWPKLSQNLEMGKYSHPCFDEVKAACPDKKNKRCFTQRKASLSQECQELLDNDGIPKIPKEAELKKATDACDGETEMNCGTYLLDMEFAENEGKTQLAENKMKESIECMKKVYENPKDENCQKAFSEFKEALGGKVAAPGGGERHEIK